MSRRVHETDDERDESERPAVKKRLLPKQRFRQAYTSMWSCLKASTKGEYFVRCSICKRDFNCSHGGQNDCKKHVNSLYHRDIVARSAKSGSMTNYLNRNNEGSKEQTLRKQTVNAEVIMCEMIAELNLPLATADSLTRCFKTMFPDSAVAKAMKCCRNKTTAIIKEVAKTAQESLIDRMKARPYTISTDGSNDSHSKQFPIVVRTFNTETNLVTSELLSLAICQGSATGENIFKLLDSELKTARVEWSKCLALGCDNASVMVGQKKGVFAFVKKEHDSVFLAGCTLHTIHNGARKAANDCLPPFEDALTDIFFYFQKSSSRLDKFKGDQDYCGVEQRKNLKHVCTRWLSISRCVERMIKNWDALKVFFAKEKQDLDNSKSNKTDTYAGKKVESVYAFVRSPTNRLFGHFLLYVHSLFEAVLVSFQAEEPKIHTLGRSLQRLVKSLFQCFLKPSALTGKLLHEVDYMQPYNVKQNDCILIGDSAEAYLKNKAENHLRAERITEFYQSVKCYFQVLCKHLLEKLPLTDPLLKHAMVADPLLRIKYDDLDRSLKFFLDKYPCLIPNGVSRQTVLEQFALYQSWNVEDMENCVSERIDTTWVAIGKLKNDQNEFPLKHLSEVICGILTIPHSSAHCERVFSCVRKNRTDQRASLSDCTLESLLLLKSRPGCFGKRNYRNDQLERFKSAYYRSFSAE